MSKPSTNSDYYFNAAILGTVRKHFPTVSEAFLCWPISEEDVPPSYARARSRGRHVPGDGNYWCSTVYYSDDISGFFYGRSFYATSITTKENRNTNNSSSVAWSHEGCTYTTYYTTRGGNRWWTQVTILQYVRPNYEQGSGRLYWTVIRNEGVVAGYRQWDNAYSAAILSTPSTYSTYWVRYLDLSKCTPLPEPDREDRHMADVIQSGAMPNLNSYLNQAYVEAFQSLPAIETNNIANLMQLFGGLAKLVTSLKTPSGLRLTEVGSLSDAWLGYRYSYCTTKSDIEELVGYVDRMRTFHTLDMVTGRGAISVPSPDGNGVYVIRCSCQTHVDDYLGIYNFAERYGVALDAYNAWDLIPYSFIFDWFFHLGDLLEKSRSRNYAIRLSPSVVWFSIAHDFVNVHGNHQSDYYRWRCHDLSFMSSYPSSLFENSRASTTTWLKRGADAIALIL